MGIYARLAATALRLLTKYGTATTLTVTDATTLQERAGVLVKYGIARHDLVQSGVMVGDIQFLMNAAALPVMGEIFTAGGLDYVVVYADPVQPGATTVAWVVYGRRK